MILFQKLSFDSILEIKIAGQQKLTGYFCVDIFSLLKCYKADSYVEIYRIAEVVNHTVLLGTKKASKKLPASFQLIRIEGVVNSIPCLEMHPKRP